MNDFNILLISGHLSTNASYYQHYINFFNKEENLLYYNPAAIKNGSVKEFCNKHKFSPDIILIDYNYVNYWVITDEYNVKDLNFNDSKIILHSHKDMYFHVMTKVKKFCDEFNIKNLFHINCNHFTKDDVNKLPLNFEKYYHGLNYHPIEYGFEQSTFGHIDYNVEKIKCLNFAGVVGNQGNYPEDSIMGMRKRFLDLTRDICKRNNFSHEFLYNKRHKSIKEYSNSMLRSKITIDTPTNGGHISARLFEIPLHKSAIMVFEDEIYDDILEDGVNSIIIKRDFSDLEQRLRFYLTNDEGKIVLEEIINNAYNKFNEKHTIINRLEYMLKLSGV